MSSQSNPLQERLTLLENLATLLAKLQANGTWQPNGREETFLNTTACGGKVAQATAPLATGWASLQLTGLRTSPDSIL